MPRVSIKHICFIQNRFDDKVELNVLSAREAIEESVVRGEEVDEGLWLHLSRNGCGVPKCYSVESWVGLLDEFCANGV